MKKSTWTSILSAALLLTWTAASTEPVSNYSSLLEKIARGYAYGDFRDDHQQRNRIRDLFRNYSDHETLMKLAICFVTLDNKKHQYWGEKLEDNSIAVDKFELAGGKLLKIGSEKILR